MHLPRLLAVSAAVKNAIDLSRTRTIARAGLLLAAIHCGAGFGQAADCIVTIRVDDAGPPGSAPLSSLQFDVDYREADGAFRGERATTECSFPLAAEGALASFTNKPELRILTGAAIVLQSIQRPYDIAHCGFDYASAPPTVAVESSSATSSM